MNYKITLWEEKPQSINNNEYIEESCICTLASSDSDTPAQIYDPVLTQNINGQNTLTFNAQYRYYDTRTKQYLDNQFIPYLKNGRIVKVETDKGFISFTITQVNKNSDKKTITCTCSDLNIIELSKTGYNIELNTELENNMGNVFELAEYVVDGTNWHIVDTTPITLSNGKQIKSDTIKSYNSEPLYVYNLTQSIVPSSIGMEDLTDPSATLPSSIPADSIFYISQTSYLNQGTKINFLWSENELETNNKRVVINCHEYRANAAALWGTTWPTLITSQSYVGSMLNSIAVTKYLTEIDKTCYQYKNGDNKYYGYNDVTFASSVDIQNMIGNNTNYVSTNDWSPATLSTYTRTERESTASTYVTSVKSALLLDFDNYSVLNTGINSSKAAFKNTEGFNSNNAFVLALRVVGSNDITNATLSYRPNETEDSFTKITAYSGEFKTKAQFESAYSVTIKDLNDDDPTLVQEPLANYVFAKMTCASGVNLSYSEVLDSYVELALTKSNQTDVKIIDAKFFKYDTITENSIAYLRIPDLTAVTDSVISDYTYIFDADLIDNPEVGKEITSIYDLTYTWKGKTSELPSGYTLITNENYELITSIEVSESNRFNILQDLCEKFECWAKLTVDTNAQGRIRYCYKNTADDEFISGKKYYTRIAGSEDELDFDDAHYTYANLAPYFSQCTSSSTYSYINRDRYYKKIDDIYVKANLGYQWGYGTYYTVTYTTQTGSSVTTKVYTQVTTGTPYSSTTQYYVAHSTSSGNVYEAVTVTNQFAQTPTNYYEMVNPNVSPIVSADWATICSNFYEKYYKKYITFNEFTGTENDAGFKYGINFNKITRNLISDSLVTKLIVAMNSNEYADGGACTIATASQNASGNNTLYNFDYYIYQGLIDEHQFNKDMYGETSTDLAYMTKYINLNSTTRTESEETAALEVTVSSLSAQYDLYSNYLTQAKTDYYNYIDDILEISKELGYSWTYDYCKTVQRSATDYPDKLNEYIDSRDTANTNINNYSSTKSTLEQELEVRSVQLDKLLASQESIADIRSALDYEFYQKYSRFIHEGTWNSDDYYDADEYYNDACKVLTASAFPVVEYSFEVIDLSDIEKWSAYDFGIGDKTYVYDTDFFSDQKSPKMEVIISTIEWHLDNPSDTKVTVQNYKTQFEDLFQRVAAATQTLEYNENKYDYASEVTTDSAKGGALVSRMLSENNNIITKADGNFTYDNSGITAIDSNPQYQTKFTTRGLVLSNDGGETWQTGISADGINASLLTAGAIDTNKISIYGGSSNRLFEWDKYGINAYTGSATDRNKYVRFDKYGIYGVIGEAYNYQPSTVSEVMEKTFALTWNGFALNSTTDGKYVRISNEGSPSGTAVPSGGTTALKKIIDAGTYTTSEGVKTYTSKFYVLEDGSMYANNGTFQGLLKANQIQVYNSSTSQWENVLSGNKISGEYINAKGITVTDSLGNTTFSVDGTTGSVNVSGTISSSTIQSSYMYSTEIISNMVNVVGNTYDTENQEWTSGTFAIYQGTNASGTKGTCRGYIGYAKGCGTVDGTPVPSHGISMTSGTPAAVGTNPIVMVTNLGIAMSMDGGSGDTGFMVCASGAFYKQPTDSQWEKVGSGTAKFG